MRILAYGKGSVLVDSVTEAAKQAGINVVVEVCAHFAANLFARGNYLPNHALVRSIDFDLTLTLALHLPLTNI